MSPRLLGSLTRHEVLHLEGSPPMFSFEDPDGNNLVFLQVLLRYPDAPR